MVKTRRNQKKRKIRRRTLKGGGGCFGGMCMGNKSTQVAPFESDEEQAARLLSEFAAATAAVNAKRGELQELNEQLRQPGLSRQDRERIKAQREPLKAEREKLSTKEKQIEDEMSDLQTRLSAKIKELIESGNLVEAKSLQDLAANVLKASLTRILNESSRVSEIMGRPFVGGGGCFFGKCMGNGTNAVAPNTTTPTSTPAPTPTQTQTPAQRLAPTPAQRQTPGQTPVQKLADSTTQIFEVIKKDMAQIVLAVQEYVTRSQELEAKKQELRGKGIEARTNEVAKNIAGRKIFQKKKITSALAGIRFAFIAKDSGLFAMSKTPYKKLLFTPERMAMYDQLTLTLDSIPADFDRQDLIQNIKALLKATLQNRPGATPTPVRRTQVAPAPAVGAGAGVGFTGGKRRTQRRSRTNSRRNHRRSRRFSRRSI